MRKRGRDEEREGAREIGRERKRGEREIEKERERMVGRIVSRKESYLNYKEERRKEEMEDVRKGEKIINL